MFALFHSHSLSRSLDMHQQTIHLFDAAIHPSSHLSSHSSIHPSIYPSTLLYPQDIWFSCRKNHIKKANVENKWIALMLIIKGWRRIVLCRIVISCPTLSQKWKMGLLPRSKHEYLNSSASAHRGATTQWRDCDEMWYDIRRKLIEFKCHSRNKFLHLNCSNLSSRSTICPPDSHTYETGTQQFPLPQTLDWNYCDISQTDIIIYVTPLVLACTPSAT